jgi:hypothetical protein
MWLKWWNACLANMRTWVQSLVLPKGGEKKNSNKKTVCKIMSRCGNDGTEPMQITAFDCKLHVILPTGAQKLVIYLYCTVFPNRI